MSATVQVSCPKCGKQNRVIAQRLSGEPTCEKCNAPLFQASPTDLKARNFDSFLERSPLPVVVSFQTTWCGICRALAPSFEAAMRAMRGRVAFARLDTDKVPELAARYDVEEVPTLILFRDGDELERSTGSMTEKQLVGWLTSKGA